MPKIQRFAVGAIVYLRGDGGLGKVDNVVKESVVRAYGHGPFLVVGHKDEDMIVMRTEKEEKIALPQNWLVMKEEPCSGANESFLPRLSMRKARPEDAGTIHRFICKLAAFEGKQKVVHATVRRIEEYMELKPTCIFDCLLVEGEDMTPVGLVLYYPRFSTWLGEVYLHLEDIYIVPEMRGRGVGRMLFAEMRRIADQCGYARRISWEMSDTNFSAARFYHELGADITRDRTFWRLTW